MRQLLTFAFLFSLFATNQLFASPIHFDVKGTMAAYANHGSSPIAHGSSVTGWYELDWAKAKFGTALPNGAIYTGILTYQFKIGNNLTLSGSNPNIEYHSTSINISPNSEHLNFQDQSANLFNIGSFLPIEDLFFYVTNKNGVHTAWFDYYSVPDFDHDNNVYSGWCNLAEINTPEPASSLIFILGFGTIFLTRFKRKNK